jgi:proteasome lid subunit RPN8/RPN11
MWISKKKFNQMMAEALEKERDRELFYRFMDETHMRMHKMEDKLDELEHIVHSHPVGKKQLNG